MLLVGNKCDLEDERCISKEEGQRLAKEWNIPFMETSAKTLHNVTNVSIYYTRLFISTFIFTFTDFREPC